MYRYLELSPLASCVLSVSLTAQRGEPRAFTPNLPTLATQYAKAVPQDVFPPAFSDTCALRGSVWTFTTEDLEGDQFIFGTNDFLDPAKIQRIIFDTDERYQVNSVSVGFAVIEEGLGDRVVSAQIYNDLSADSTFGTLLATSDPVAVSDILLSEDSILFTTFTFPTPAVLLRDSFLIFIDLSDVYEADSNGDIAIFGTPLDCGSGRNALEIITDGTNSTYTDVFTSYGDFNSEMYVYATVDTEISVSTRTPLVDYGTQVSPNPTSDRVQLRFTTTPGSEYRASLSDLQGRQVRTTAPRKIGSQTTIDWSLADLPAGLYLYHIDGPAGRQSGKVVKR